MTKRRLLSIILVLSFVFMALPTSYTLADAGQGDGDAQSIEKTIALLKLNLGDTANVTANLDLVSVDDINGTAIVWTSSNENYLWNDGTVIRPPYGDDVTVTLLAAVSSGNLTESAVFEIGIPAYESSIRAIETVHAGQNTPANEFNIEVPVGTSPKLPYRVWVNYTDGYGEWRQMQWPWSGIVGTGADRSGPIGSNTPPDQEEQWKAKPVGEEYTVTGWIIGDNATALGYPVTVSCTVVDGVAKVPENEVKADALPMSKVKLTGENRMSSNALRAVAQYANLANIAGDWHPDTYLWNYRDVYGVEQPVGVREPRGWESPTQKLRGHGVGHYINGLALAYVSGLGTTEEREAILGHITYMIDEMRKLQEMTFVKTGEDGEGNSIFREGSNVWPYYAEDKAELAPDWPYPLLSEVTSPPPARYDNYEYRSPEWFGYGYLHATAPIHPVLNEAYRPYSEWIWAPYYSIHKQMAGLMDVYYSLKDDPVTKDTADKALLICRDMGRWISDRLTTKCRIEPTRNTDIYGNLGATWYANISGEYGGVNESIARCAMALPESDPYKALLVKGSEMFDNKFYWDPLAENSEIMWNGTAAVGGNSHANQRIPQMAGVLWSYRGTGTERYYNIAKNFFDFNAGRHRFYGGNVGVGEWYYRPYQQLAALATNSAANETCCATNLARLSKDLACFDPDNAEYMDYYERVTYNQLVGSVVQETWNAAYQYPVAANARKSDLRGAYPGQSCCGGTGAENALRYTDGTYLVSDNAIWINMYIPTEVTWDNAGVMVKQDCVWPAENSKITVSALAGAQQKSFEMHLRVPWWATRGFDIKLNGESVADSYTPSSYVVIPEREWLPTDTVEVVMPFVESIDYAPDKREGSWAGVIFNGPLAMSGVGDWSTLELNYDLSNIVRNEPYDLPDTASNTVGNNKNLYTVSVSGQNHTDADIMRPDYYTGFTATNYPAEDTGGSGGRTLYYMINMIPTDGETDRTNLYGGLNNAMALEAANYADASFDALEAAISAAVAVYQNEEATQEEIDAQVAALSASADSLVPVSGDGKSNLLSAINTALELKAAQEAWEKDPDKTIDNKPAAPFAYANVLLKLADSQAVYDSEEATVKMINVAYTELDGALQRVRLGYMPEIEDLEPLNKLLGEARALRANDYTLDSYQKLEEAIENGDREVIAVTVGSSTIDQETVPNAIAMINDAIDGLEDDFAEDRVNIWETTNFMMLAGDTDFAVESDGNYFREGALLDMQNWTSRWHYEWRLTPDENHEFFQFRRQTASNATSGTVMGPDGYSLTAGTALVLVHGDATNDAQWWKPIRQADGKFIIVNKADPTLCVAIRGSEPVSGGRIQLAALDAPGNTWRLLGGDGLAAEIPDATLEKKVISVAPMASIAYGEDFDISLLDLPDQLSVTFEGNSKAVREIIWDYEGFVTGGNLYGDILLDGIEVNPDGVRAVVDVVYDISSKPDLVIVMYEPARTHVGSLFDPAFELNSSVSMTVDVIIAQYSDSDILEKLETKTVELVGGQSPVSVSLSLVREEGKAYKFFVWDNDSYAPLSNVTG